MGGGRRPRAVAPVALLLLCIGLLTLAPASARALDAAAGAGALPSHPPSSHGKFKVVRYRGFSVTVPASWPVIRLSRRPHACVRFDRHAVYLGTPGAIQDCPAHAIGRAEAILLSPQRAGAAAAGAANGPALPPGGGASTSFVVPRRGIRVTATWGRDPKVVTRALAARSISSLRRRGSATAGAAAARPRAHISSGGGVYTGLGFDVCSTPSTGAMSSWDSSPYRAIGVYIGGANMACSQPNLTSTWVGQESAAGWHLVLIYVGLQAPSNSCGCAGISSGSASSQGTAAADDAIARAQALGIGSGNPIYDDMEAYSRTSTNTTAVMSFLSAWTTELHARGYRSGIYSSSGSGIADLVARYGTSYAEPDELWIADWNGAKTTSDPSVPSSYWANHQRIHQYDGGHNETWGGVTLNIDHDYLDAATAGSSGCQQEFADGTFLEVSGSYAVYRVAGGAPLLVSDWSNVGGQQPVTVITPDQFAALCPVPASGTFLTTATGNAYRVAGGAPIRISDWSRLGGVQPAVEIDQWDLDNLGNPTVRMYRTPANGTTVLGSPSGQYWSFEGGRRWLAKRSASAVLEDDAGLAVFPAVPCKAPRLKHKTLAQAKKAIAKADCLLGKVRRPRHRPRHHRLHVSWQIPRAGRTNPAGWRIGIRLR